MNLLSLIVLAEQEPDRIMWYQLGVTLSMPRCMWHARW